jgi:hypothetical protein
MLHDVQVNLNHSNLKYEKKKGEKTPVTSRPALQ